MAWQASAIDAELLTLRRITYGLFVELGSAPSAEQVAERLGATRELVALGWRELHAAHALVLKPGSDEILMANPLSAVATPYRVHAAGRSWYANCAWDAFGICAALATDGRIETRCGHCGEAIAVEVRSQQPNDRELLFHCLVPAARWWDDIVFT